jgi:5'-nucleotidase
MSAETPSHKPPIVIAVTARALFDLEESHQVFEKEGKEAYKAYQAARENEPLKAGPALPLVRKLLGLNALLPDDAAHIDVVLISRNDSSTAPRLFASMEHHGLGLMRAILTGGAPSSNYIKAMNTKLFLSSNPTQVIKALEEGIAAATIMPRPPGSGPTESRDDIRIAFDGDAVLFSDESEQAYLKGGLDGFHQYEKERAHIPLAAGPFRGFLEVLHTLQEALGENCPIRTALVTARGLPAQNRPLLTLQDWGVKCDEYMFLAGNNKGPMLKAFGADLFFDDSQRNIDNALDYYVASGHVPHGARNVVGADERNFTGGQGAEPNRPGVAAPAVLPPGQPIVTPVMPRRRTPSPGR